MVLALYKYKEANVVEEAMVEEEFKEVAESDEDVASVVAMEVIKVTADDEEINSVKDSRAVYIKDNRKAMFIVGLTHGRNMFLCRPCLWNETHSRNDHMSVNLVGLGDAQAETAQSYVGY